MNTPFVSRVTHGIVNGLVPPMTIERHFPTFEDARDDVNGRAQTIVEHLEFVEVASGRFEKGRQWFEVEMIDDTGFRWFPVVKVSA